MTDVNEILRQAKRLADIRQRRDLEKLDEPIRANKWRNMWFLKSGKCFHGQVDYPSEDAAKTAVVEWENTLTDKNGFILHPWNVPVAEYSHAIQIPVLS
jgi:hypothetical protein